ncbi:MAG: hypothetical protein K9H25_21820 [Rhodospirillum sp.]|nr:hypothetical protein [Rhodospirillum sp.]MCF8491774.1 hypothetical protein [Rhodospirillum sp.]
MNDHAWHRTLDETPVLHRAGCDAVKHPGALSEGLEGEAPDIDALAKETRDEIIAYGLAVRPAYDLLKRLLGQYAGLLVLAYGSRRRDYVDLVILKVAGDQLREAAETLGGLRPPRRVQIHHDALRSACQALAGIQHRLAAGEIKSDADKDRAHAILKTVQNALSQASDSRFAMTMVDFRQACCCGASA